jgi:hypothetical protein
MQLHNILNIKSLYFCCEVWMMKQTYIKRLNRTEVKFTGLTAGYNLLYCGRNGAILELTIGPVKSNLAQYYQKLLSNVIRLEDIRHPEQLPDYGLMGGRPGRPMKRLLYLRPRRGRKVTSLIWDIGGNFK